MPDRLDTPEQREPRAPRYEKRGRKRHGHRKRCRPGNGKEKESLKPLRFAIVIYLLIVFAAGILVGLLLRMRERSFKGDVPLSVSVLLMIFFMGASMGSDEALRDSAVSIGWQSLIFLAFTVSGSCAAAYIWWRWSSD
jgi:uncharacterized membrane protein YbjE (DUF340 family)